MSDTFLIPQWGGSKQFILNLVNLIYIYVYSEHFKVEDLRTATKLISHGSFMVNIEKLIF